MPLGTNRGRRFAIGLAVAAAAVTAILLAAVNLSPIRRAGRGRPTIGFLTEHTGRGIDTHFTLAAEALGDVADLREVSLGAPGALDSLDVLVVLGSGHLPDARLYEIDQFLMRGGRAAFLLDGAKISDDRMKATVVRGNLFAYVESYGASVNPDLVIDPAGGGAAYAPGADARPYPFWLVGIPRPRELRGDLMPRDGDVVFTWASSITLTERPPESARVEVLATSSEESWTTLAFTDLDPDVEQEPDPAAAADPAPSTRERFPLAVAIEGALASAFKGMPVIVEGEDGSAEFTYPEGRLDLSEPTRIIVTGCSRMFEDDVAERVPSNLELLTNVIDWLSTE